MLLTRFGKKRAMDFSNKSQYHLHRLDIEVALLGRGFAWLYARSVAWSFFVVTSTLIWLAGRLGYWFWPWFQTHDLILLFNEVIPRCIIFGQC